MTELFDRFFRGLDLAPLDAPGPLGAGFRPRIDVAETEHAIEVSAELPGIAEKDVDVSLAGDVLTIRGERKHEHEESEKEWYRKEQSYGSFHRAIALPAEVDPDKVAASFAQGVLKVTLPKVVGARSKRITVRAA
jgi:HSP20 family protein